MLKRTKGRILLTMLVVTGLAGTINNSTLSNQERKFAISQLKDTRTELINTIKNLSEKQVNFKPPTGQWSIRDCFYHLTLTEKILWEKLEVAMKEPANPEKRLELTFSDKDLIELLDNRDLKALHASPFMHATPDKQSTTAALAAFKSFRTARLKYVKTTTEDLRNHFIQVPPLGLIDCYQAIIFMLAYSNHYIRQINEILASPGFPKS